MKSKHMLLLILGTIALSACIPKTGELKPEDTMVFDHVKRSTGFPGHVLKVNNTQTQLEVLGPENRKCKKEHRKKKGCLSIRRGHLAHHKFKLHDDDVKADWVFNEFSICVGATKQAVCTLAVYQSAEFRASSKKNGRPFFNPGENGKVNLTALSPDLTEFVLFNGNSIRQDYFYNIKACKKGSSPLKCVDLDPVIRNRGR